MPDHELWALAFWVHRHHGEGGQLYIAQEIARVWRANDSEGTEMWRKVAERFEDLHRAAGAGQRSQSGGCAGVGA